MTNKAQKKLPTDLEQLDTLARTIAFSDQCHPNRSRSKAPHNRKRYRQTKYAVDE